MSEPISVTVHAHDPVSSAGVASQLRSRVEVSLQDDGAVPADGVALVVVDDVDDEAVRTVKAIRQGGCDRVVVVATRLDDKGLLSAVEAGACALMRRSDALPDKLVQTVSRAAAGDGTVPPDLLGRLLEQIGLLQRQVLAPRGLTFSGLSEREIEVLRLIAEGLDTTEVAGRLCYSERTVKNVLHADAQLVGAHHALGDEGHRQRADELLRFAEPLEASLQGGLGEQAPTLDLTVQFGELGGRDVPILAVFCVSHRPPPLLHVDG